MKGKRQRETAHFLRVKSVEEVVTTTIKRLAAAGKLTVHSNVPQKCMWLMLAGDKDSTSTKLMLVFLNAEKQHFVNPLTSDHSFANDIHLHVHSGCELP